MGELWVLTGRSGRVWPKLLQGVVKSRQEGRRVILYVPEQMTLQTERNLIAGLQLKGLLDIEVISPKKLCLLVKEKAGESSREALEEFGQVMAVHRAMTECAEELQFYRNMTELPGAVKRIREALTELRESEITLQETEDYAAEADAGAAREKLLDMNRIRSAFEALVSERFDDEKASWTEMIGRMKQTDLFSGADLLVYGFDTIRPDLRELLCGAYDCAEHIYVFLTGDNGINAPDQAVFEEQRRTVQKLAEALGENGRKTRTVQIREEREYCSGMLRWLDGRLFADTDEVYPGETGDELTLYAAADREDEADQAAECLLEWHAQGIPWERMAVALPQPAELEGPLLSCLRLNGIPYFRAEKTPAASHGIFRMLTGAMECISDGYTAEHVTEAALSGFTLLEDEEALLLQNYAEAHGIDGARWREPFTAGADAEAAEKARRKLIFPMEHLRENLKNAKNAEESARALVRFLEEESTWKRLLERGEILMRDGLYREALTDRQVWKMLNGLLDQLWAMLGGRRASIRDLKSMLECALDGAAISALPETDVGVAVGEVGHLTAEDVEALILPGCQEGVMSVRESGWLSDREREDLSEHTGRDVGMTRERRGWIRKYDFYRAMTLPSGKLRISWSLREGDGSPLQEARIVSQLRAVFPRIRETGGLLGSGEKFNARTPMQALESIGGLLDGMEEGKRDREAEKAVIALMYDGIFSRTAREMLEERCRFSSGPALLADTARKLFRSESASISRLERYAACPYQHFIDYGLRPVRRETYDFDSADAGSFFHDALDRFMKTAGAVEGWPRLPEERVDGIMDAICAELTEEWENGPLREDAMGIWQGEEYLRRVHHAARVLTRFAANSDFRTIATEQSFGKGDGGLPPLTLTLADGSRVALQGVIDRIDTYENGEGIWLRVVDNKSAFKKPDPEKMEDGEQLQLMIYLKAASLAYPGIRPAGALFFPIQDAEISTEDETPENIEAERMKKVRMKGLVNARQDVVRAMDRDLSPYSVDEVFSKKDGSVRKGADWAVEEDVLQGLMTAAEQKAAEICGGIREGRIEPAPRGTSEEDSPCRYCTYRTLCRATRQSLVPRKEGITYRDLARDAAGKITLREEEK